MTNSDQGTDARILIFLLIIGLLILGIAALLTIRKQKKKKPEAGWRSAIEGKRRELLFYLSGMAVLFFLMLFVIDRMDPKVVISEEESQRNAALYQKVICFEDEFTKFEPKDAIEDSIRQIGIRTTRDALAKYKVLTESGAVVSQYVVDSWNDNFQSKIETYQYLQAALHLDSLPRCK